MVNVKRPLLYLRAFSRVVRPTCHRLTSATPSRHLSTPLAQGRVADLLGYCALTFHAYARRIYVQPLRTGIGLLKIFAPSSELHASYAVSFRQASAFACGFLQIPPRNGHPCRPANDSPCRARRGLSPPSKSALPGARIKEKGGLSRPFLLSRAYCPGY